jgi:hypothetical protein
MGTQKRALGWFWPIEYRTYWIDEPANNAKSDGMRQMISEGIAPVKSSMKAATSDRLALRQEEIGPERHRASAREVPE